MPEPWIPLTNTPSAIWKANLESAKEHHPGLLPLLQSGQADEAVELLQEPDGLWRGRLHLGSRVVPLQRESTAAQEWERLSREAQTVSTGPHWVFFAGIGLGYGIRAAYKTAFRPSLFLVVEENALFLRAAMRTIDLRPLLMDDMVRWFVGSEALDECEAAIRGELSGFFLVTREPVVFLGPDAGRGQKSRKDTLDRIRNVFNREQKRSQAEVLSFVQYLQSPRDKVRKLWFYRFPHLSWVEVCESLAKGMRENGIEIHLHPMPPTPSFLESLAATRHVISFQPDAVVCLNHPSNMLLRGLDPFPVPRWLWYVDSPEFLSKGVFSPYDLVFPCDQVVIAPLFESDVEITDELPIACDIVVPPVSREFVCDVAFVGRLTDVTDARRRLPKEVKEYVDEWITRRLRTLPKPLDEFHDEDPLPPEISSAISEAMKPQWGHKWERPEEFVYAYLSFESAVRRRVRTLLAMPDCDIKIYGSPNWEEELRGTHLERAFQGRYISIEERRVLYCSARINLNIHRAVPHITPTQRDLEVPGSRGFLLSDLALYAGEHTKDFFEPSTEMVFFVTPEEAGTQARYYLDHEEERLAIIERGYNRVVRNHTYKKRAREMVELAQRFHPNRPPPTPR